MHGLTTLGVIHTAISLAAVACGLWTLARHWEISSKTSLGRTYLFATLLAVLTGLGISRHESAGMPHALALVTLLALAVGFAASVTGVRGRGSRYLQAICYSSTVLLHLVLGVTEALTRLPAGAPVMPSAEAAELRTIHGALLLVWSSAWLSSFVGFKRRSTNHCSTAKRPEPRRSPPEVKRAVWMRGIAPVSSAE